MNGADEYRIVATGSRYAKSDRPIHQFLFGYVVRYGSRLHVAAGGATGVDTLVEQWACRLGVRFKRYAVDHALDGPWPAAGPRRNRRMHDDFQPHEVVAFPGGRGTESMKAIARHAGTPVTEVSYLAATPTSMADGESI